MDKLIPRQVLHEVLGDREVALLTCRPEPLATSTGAATGAVERLQGMAVVGGRRRPFALVRKRVQPLQTGRHARAAADPRHWAYWQRELLAYAAGVLPDRPDFAAPRCYGVTHDSIYLEDAGEIPESPRDAARRLGAWQAATGLPDLPWLAGDQLQQRLAVTHLDWASVDADPRWPGIWAARHDLMTGLGPLPKVLSHGDFHLGQLRRRGSTTVVLDWAALGISPVGADLAHLSLSAQEDLTSDFLAGLRGCFDPAAVRAGYRITLALTAASRVHWMLSRGLQVPPGYPTLAFAVSP